jgi:hypothetical protein
MKVTGIARGLRGAAVLPILPSAPVQTGQDRLFGSPYVSRHTVCYVPVTSG